MFHLFRRKSGHLALCPRYQAGPPSNQVRASIVPHLQLLLTTPQDQVGCRAPEIDHAAMPEVSPQPAAGSQALWALWWVAALSAPRPRQTRVKLRLQVTARQHLMAKRGKNALKLKTPSPCVSQVFSTHEDTDSESNPEEKIQSIQQKWHQPSPKEDTPSKESSESSSEEEPTTDKALRDEAQHRAWQLDTNFNALHDKKIAKGITGWATRDTMICDLPEHGKVKPNHPDPVGPPLD